MLAPWIELILIITGAVTAGAVVIALAPLLMMKIVFAQAPADPLSLLIARHWGLLVGLVGGLLIYAAFHAEVRVPVLIVAIVEKAAIVFGLLMSPYRRRPPVIAIVLGDGGMATMYLIILISR
jgi:hypothetical protein